MKIRIFVTGGTFDKEYNEIQEALLFQDTHLPEILKLGRCKVDIDIRTLMMVDSLAMTDEERKMIVENCVKAQEKNIIITHGTGTMEKTAKELGEAIKDKTIILTGAMVPYAYGSSDGMFNLGSAIAFAQSLPPGVYVAMNGKFFNFNNVHKNTKTGIFEEIQ